MKSLPRVRGDRPLRTNTGMHSSKSAPRTRGSTSVSAASVAPALVCPAYAGIDPLPPATGRRRSRLPRVRGDRPPEAVELDNSLPSAPRTRGSTSMARHQQGHRHVCPAYAGIDLIVSMRSQDRICLPRVRGDRPLTPELYDRLYASAPRTRGSTRRRLRSRCWIVVCPAYAGIDLRRALAPRPTSRLPRVRGDRPECSRRCACLGESAPRTRGSTSLPL